MVLASGGQKCSDTNAPTQRWEIRTVNAASSHYYIYSWTDIYLLFSRNPTGTTVYCNLTTVDSLWELELVTDHCTVTPLIQQEDPNTCNMACARMVLATHGITNVSEDELVAYGGTYYQYIYRIIATINHYLSENNQNISYMYSYTSPDVTTQYADFQSNVIASLNAGGPIIIHLALPENNHYGYVNPGHYVVIMGVYLDSNNEYQAIVNDPHYEDSKFERKIVKLRYLFDYNVYDTPDNVANGKENDFYIHINYAST